MNYLTKNFDLKCFKELYKNQQSNTKNIECSEINLGLCSVLDFTNE